MSEDTGLEELLLLFTDTDPDIAQRRAEVIQTLRENDVASYPSDILVLSAFDDVLQCFALGGQIKNYYRYGSYTTCSEQRKKFWFSLWNGSVSGSSEDVDTIAQNPRELGRRQEVQRFYKEQLLELKQQGSSDDIWEERKTLLRSPFKE